VPAEPAARSDAWRAFGAETSEAGGRPPAAAVWTGRPRRRTDAAAIDAAPGARHHERAIMCDRSRGATC